MNYPFGPGANSIAKLVLAAIVVVVVGSATLATGYFHSPLHTGEGDEITQPVMFSHKHHVTGLGLDCRYCHSSVESSKFAGIPDAKTCRGCHDEIWSQSAMLKPVRESNIDWNRVVRLPDYVYFSHEAHTSHGIGCVSCHGQVSEMNRVVQVRSFLMKDCLSCHENPAPHVRPLDHLTDEKWSGETTALAEHLGVHKLETTNCSVCHR